MARPHQSSSGIESGGRRSLPRVSHACQRCRAKKAKCDQKQPCLACIKRSVTCEYGIRRRGGRRKQQPLRDTVEGPSPCRPPAFNSRSPSGPEQRQPSQPPQETTPSDFRPQTLSADGLDVVGDINQRTQGTEFYGTSSNFVLLNQLFAFAREHNSSRYMRSNGHENTPHLFPVSTAGNDDFVTPRGLGLALGEQDTRAGLRAPPQDRVSIINLLSNEEGLSPPSRPKTPAYGQQNDSDRTHRATNETTASAPCDNLRGHTQSTSVDGIFNMLNDSSPATRRSYQSFTGSSTQSSKIHLERVYVHIFLDNLHHLHPMLDPVSFEKRCEKDIWFAHSAGERQKGFRHFFALYNIVVAVGALIAGSHVFKELERDIRSCITQSAESESSGRIDSSQAVSRRYFRRSKDLLGDTFSRTRSLTLTWSLYCQNSHMPHRCYMYCGQAVRTALAIGLANESTSMSTEDQKAARRTWWCIYSHEIDMSCSSGRRDSLRKPHNYQTPLPLIRDQEDVSDTPKSEDRKVAMINEMVRFAAILRRISKELYHDAKGLTLLQKSSIAKELDDLLSDWRSKLPDWLDFGKLSFREEEWAGKQKLVLYLRYLNARILAHRLFLAPRADGSQVDVSSHVGLCLEAARETIQVLYVAYAHRHYFRTWWYNSTYTLYAGMIVFEDLLNDVVKAQSILESMQEATVALRSAELLREGLEIARSSSQHETNLNLPLTGGHTSQVNGIPHTRLDIHDSIPYIDQQTLRTAFPTYDTDPGPLFASLIDPGLLQDFTTGLNTLADLGDSSFLLDNSYSSWPGDYHTPTFS
ncbi:putative C6 transcription factor [Boeremia exigua]|uniref:putative C6 transcription factor n=1 Tax=Boeremia exigua TaxID=749465 RepID=UPI001E8D74FD|nr:putative C6 transcription factor [Boeremia exigua]KAH6643238.1 putative C6 transcription factor [Boeremia exigua]